MENKGNFELLNCGKVLFKDLYVKNVVGLISKETNRLTEENKRLSIYPLIQAGELPTIAEGLTEQDQYNSFSDLINYVEKRFGALPAPMATAAKYAVISRDTAVYQGLNRLIKFGDFTA